MALLVIAATAFAGVALAGGDASTGEPPSIRTAWADPVNETGAIVAANMTALGSASEAAVGVKYRPNGTANWSFTTNRTVSQTGLVTFNLTDLASDTEYEYRALTRTANGTDFGAIRTVTTPNDDPVVTTDGAAAVTEEDALLTGALTDLGGATQATVRFAYRPVSSDTFNLTANQTVTAANEFSQRVDGLSPNQTYEFRALVAANDGDRAAGELRTVTTDPAFAVETEPATSVNETSARLEGGVTAFGDADSATTAFEYREQGTTNWTTVGTTVTSNVSFSAVVTDLASETTYEYRATATADDGDRNTGAIRTLHTDGVPSIVTRDAGAVDDDSATLSANVTDLGGADSATVSIQYRQADADDWQTAEDRTVNTTSQVAATVTGLASGTTYEYRAVLDTSDGDRAVGTVETVTTDASDGVAPSVESVSVSDESPPNPHVSLQLVWHVADEDGDLDSVQVTVRTGDGDVAVTETRAVSGSADDGSLATRIKHGVGETYTVTIAVTDAAGTTTTENETFATSRFKGKRGPPAHAAVGR